MIYPALESFLAALGYLYCVDDFVRKAVERLGIRFRSLPNCHGQEVGSKAQEIRDSALIKHELGGDIAFLERGVQDFKQVPVDDLALGAKLRSLLEDNKIYEICKNGITNVQDARRQMMNLQETLADDVSSGPYSAMVTTSLYELKEEALKNEAVVEIKGFEKLSRMIGGFNFGRLGILLADTGYGKTNIGLQLALRARLTMPTAYVNQEMSMKDISKRIAVLESKVSYSDFYSKLQNAEWIESFKDDGKGFYITDGSPLSPKQIKAWIRSLRHDGMFVVVDYDQCLNLETNRDMPEWKALQKALSDFDEFSRQEGTKCFILVLAQLNRDGEISSSHRATYKAHTVLHFKDDEIHGSIIHAKKNRHGRKDASLKVRYNQDNSNITEIEDFILAKQKKEKRTLSAPKTPVHKPYWEDR